MKLIEFALIVLTIWPAWCADDFPVSKSPSKRKTSQRLVFHPEHSLIPDPIYIATEYACLVPNYLMNHPLIDNPQYMNHPLVFSLPIFYACRDFIDPRRKIPPVTYHEFINHAMAEKSLTNGGISYSWLIVTLYGISGVITVNYPNRLQTYDDEDEEALISGIALPALRQLNQSRQILEAILNHKLFYKTNVTAIVDPQNQPVVRLLKNAGFYSLDHTQKK